jgi:hypothetical protein
MQHLLPIYGFIYFGMLNSLVPTLMFLAIMLSWVPHDMMYGPQAAPIAECFTPRLRYSGSLDRLSARLDYGRGAGPAGLLADRMDPTPSSQPAARHSRCVTP